MRYRGAWMVGLGSLVLAGVAGWAWASQLWGVATALGLVGLGTFGVSLIPESEENLDAIERRANKTLARIRERRRRFEALNR